MIGKIIYNSVLLILIASATHQIWLDSSFEYPDVWSAKILFIFASIVGVIVYLGVVALLIALFNLLYNDSVE